MIILVRVVVGFIISLFGTIALLSANLIDSTALWLKLDNLRCFRRIHWRTDAHPNGSGPPGSWKDSFKS